MPAQLRANRSVAKYLAKYADSHSVVADAIEGCFSHGVMIPAFAEGRGLVTALESIPSAPGGVMVVVVVNRPLDAAVDQVARHDESLRSISARWPAIAGATDLPAFGTLHDWPGGCLLVLDVRVPRRRGVGLARKIGCDVLLRMWANNTLTQPWLHMSDADARWPADFFARSIFVTPVDPAPSALIRTYTHEAADEAHAEACLRYEARLRHHVLGLQWAGSPYAYEAIGSTISCHALAYAQVRGVPSRPAAEDFYLLNKLAKMGPVRTVPGAPMRVSGRVSNRVPFGTGAALGAAVERAQMPLCYDPQLFQWLRLTLCLLDNTLVAQSDLGAALETVAQPSRVWLAGIEERGLRAVIDAVQATGLPLAKRRRRLRDQVDAFATLKLLHAWRSRGLPDVPLEDAVARSPFCLDAGITSPPSASNADLERIVGAFAALELRFEFDG